MDRKAKLALMDKLALKYPKKITADRAEKKIIEHLEEEGLPEDVELEEDEMAWLEEQGFSFGEVEDSGDEEEVEEEDGDWEEDEEEEEAPKQKKEKKSKDKKDKKDKKEKKAKKDKPKGVSKCAAIEAAILKIVKKAPATRKEIVEQVMAAIPDANKSTIGVRISRAKKKETTPFGSKVLVEGDLKKLVLK